MGDFTLESASIDILGIGLCTVDLLFAVPHVPQFDHSTRASQFLRQGGGPAATTLATFTRLAPWAWGAFIGKFGDDEDGDFIRCGLEQEGIDICNFAVARGALVEESSVERGFVTRSESCSELAPSDICKEIVSSARIVHLDDADATCMQAATWAREAGRTVVFDRTWMHELSSIDVVKKPREHGAHLAVYTRGARDCVAH